MEIDLQLSSDGKVPKPGSPEELALENAVPRREPRPQLAEAWSALTSALATDEGPTPEQLEAFTDEVALYIEPTFDWARDTPIADKAPLLRDACATAISEVLVTSYAKALRRDGLQ